MDLAQWHSVATANNLGVLNEIQMPCWLHRSAAAMHDVLAQAEALPLKSLNVAAHVSGVTQPCPRQTILQPAMGKQGCHTKVWSGPHLRGEKMHGG